MPESMKFLSVDEIISFFESIYSNEQQRAIVQILFQLDHTVIKPSPLLDDLLKKNVLQISSSPHIPYRLDKFFAAKNIHKISERKNFIFSKVPDLKGLKRGKSASYEDLVDFVSEKYTDLFCTILHDIKIYSFTDAYSQNGKVALLYLNRKLNPKANYKFNPKTSNYELKEDEVTEVLRRHNIQFEVDNPAALFSAKINIDECIEHGNLTDGTCRMPLWKLILLIIFWPVGIYYLFKKCKNRKQIQRGQDV